MCTGGLGGWGVPRHWCVVVGAEFTPSFLPRPLFNLLCHVVCWSRCGTRAPGSQCSNGLVESSGFGVRICDLGGRCNRHVFSWPGRCVCAFVAHRPVRLDSVYECLEIGAPMVQRRSASSWSSMYTKSQQMTSSTMWKWGRAFFYVLILCNPRISSPNICALHAVKHAQPRALVPVWARFNCLLNKYCTEEIDLRRATISIKSNCHSTNWNFGHVCPLFASHWLGSGCPWSTLLCTFNSTRLVFVQQFWALSIPLRAAINRPHPQFGKGGFGRLEG